MSSMYIDQCDALGEGKGDQGPQGLNYDQIKRADMPLTEDSEVALLALSPESQPLLVVSTSYQEQSICQINRYWGSGNMLGLAVTAGERESRCVRPQIWRQQKSTLLCVQLSIPCKCQILDS